METSVQTLIVAGTLVLLVGFLLGFPMARARMAAPNAPRHLVNALRDAFATWLGWVVPENTPLLFVVGDEPIERVLDECLLVGYEQFAGVLAGGMAAWDRAGLPMARATLVSIHDGDALLRAGALALDVREASGFAGGRIPGATHVPPGELSRRVVELPRDRPIVTYCGHGERSATALSFLESAGFGELANLNGGFGGWKEAGLPTDSG